MKSLVDSMESLTLLPFWVIESSASGKAFFLWMEGDGEEANSVNVILIVVGTQFKKVLQCVLKVLRLLDRGVGEDSPLDDFDLLVDRLTNDLSAEIMSGRKGIQENTLTAHRNTALRHNNNKRREARRRNISHCYDPAVASRIQKLYQSNLPKAMRDPQQALILLCNPVRETNLILPGGVRPFSSERHAASRVPSSSTLRCLCRERGTRLYIMGSRGQTYKDQNHSPRKRWHLLQLPEKTRPHWLVLTAIFNKWKQFRCTPSSWKKSMTVLIYKKGKRGDPDNWRPISLCSTMYKLYASCLAARITDWWVNGGAISSIQKGFMSCEGCYEHNFVLQTAIHTSRREQRQCAIVWLDLANAFGSMPHCTFFSGCESSGCWKTFSN
ncbi:unnamed protein product [Lepidochelys olivacea]